MASIQISYDKGECKSIRVMRSKFAAARPIICLGTHLERRAMRDQIQREAALIRAALARKRVPKVLRERDIKRERNSKYDGVVEQMFGNVLGSSREKVENAVDKAGAAAVNVSKAGANVSSAASTVARAVNDFVGTGTVMRETGDAVKKAMSSLTESNSILTKLLETLNDIAESFKKIMGTALWVVPVVLIVWYAVYHYGGANLFVATLVVSALGALLPIGLWDVISKFFQKADDKSIEFSSLAHSISMSTLPGVTEQAGSFTDTAAALIASVFTFTFLGKKTTDGQVTEFMKRLSSWDRISANLEKFMDWILRSLETMVNYALNKFGFDSVTFWTRAKTDIELWADDIDAIQLEAATDTDRNSVKLANKLVKLLQQGSVFRRMTPATSPLHRTIEQYWHRANALLMPYQGMLSARKNFRVEPVCGMLVGAPGIGKTKLLAALCSHVLISSGAVEPAEVKEHLWQKGSSEYWNGYMGQACVLIDDAFQLRPMTGDKDNEYMNIIRMISSWAFPLNFADLESKGKIYFDSVLVVGTTNTRKLSEAPHVITDVGAVIRRLEFSYTLCLNPDFAIDGKLDIPKYNATVKEHLRQFNARRSAEPELSPLDSFPWHIWTVRKHEWMEGGDGPEQPLRDMVAQMSDKLRDRIASHGDNVAEVDSIADVYSWKPPSKPEATAPMVEQAGFRDRAYAWVMGEHESEVECESCIPLADVLAEDTSCADYVSAQSSRLTEPIHWYPDSEVSGNELTRREIDELYERRETADANARALKAKLLKQLDTKLETETVVRKKWYEFSGSPAGRFITAGRYTLLFLTASLAVTGLVAIGRWLWSVLSTMMPNRWKKGVPRGKSETEDQSNRPLARGAMRIPTNHVVLQSLDTSVQFNVYENSYKMFSLHEGGAGIVPTVIGQIQFVGQQMAVMPAHFTVQIKKMISQGELAPDSALMFRNAVQEALEIKISVRQFLAMERYTFPDTDVEFAKFPSSIRGHRDVSNNYALESDIVSHASAVPRTRLDVCEVDDLKQVLPFNRHFIHTYSDMTLVRDRYITGQKRTRLFEYPGVTKSGDCGAPFCLFDHRIAQGRACLGFHIAGNSVDLGYSAIVTQEMISQAGKALGVILSRLHKDVEKRGYTIHQCAISSSLADEALEVIPVSIHPMREDELQEGLLLPGNVQEGYWTEYPAYKAIPAAVAWGSFIPIGVVDKPVPLCPVTSYYKTSIGMQEPFGPFDHKPAHLKGIFTDIDGGLFKSPMSNALAKYASPVLHYDHDWLDQAVWVAFEKFRGCTRGAQPRLYTFDEAVVGVPGEKFRSIPRGTAPGYPYVHEVKGGKRAFFGDGVEYDLTGPKCAELRVRVDEIIAAAKRGERLGHIFIDFLKDELRPPAKVDNFDTRLISSSPVDYTVAVRMYFGAFCAAVFRNSVDCGWGPGMCQYTDWEKAKGHLTSHGPDVFDGDFKAFDTTEMPCIFERILNAINAWYDDGEENALVRKVLFQDLMHSVHLGGNGGNQKYVYQWNKCMPSGHPLTAVVGSAYATVLLVGCYIDLTGDWTGYWNHVYSLTFGDDNVSNPSKAVLEKYNQITVGEAMGRLFGVRYTPGHKDAEFEASTTIDKVTFLKRSFVESERGLLCPLELSSFLYTMYWCKNKKYENQILKDNMEVAFEELSMHPKELWDKYAPMLKKIGKQKRWTFASNPDSQDAYLSVVLSRKDNWY